MEVKTLSFLYISLILIASIGAQNCVNNEKRPENQAACKGKPFGKLVPYPGNCSQYLVCDCEYPTVRPCAPGTWFHSCLSLCVWPQQSDCKETTSMPTEPTTPSSTQPTTISTTPTTQSTTPTTQSTTPTTQSTTPTTQSTTPTTQSTTPTTQSTTPTTESTTPTTQSTTPTTESTTPTTHTTRSTTNKTHYTTNSTTPLTTPTTISTTIPTTISTIPTDTTPTKPDCELPDFINDNYCQGQPNGELFPYVYDCNAYMNCTNSCPVLNYCPPDKVFNSLLLICDTPDTAQCIEKPIPSTTPTTTTETTTITTTETTTVSTLPPDVDPSVCEHLPTNTILPYAGNCSEFLLCLSGKVIIESCPDDLLFNPDLMICDNKGDFECYTQQNSTTPIPTISTTAETTTPVYELCKGASEGTTFANVNDCSLYYYCHGNDTSTIIPCPSNNWYNPTTGNCGPAVSPDACKAQLTTTAPTTINPVDRCKGQEDGTTFPNPENCQHYFYCSEETVVPMFCPINNYFNPVTGRCGPNVAPTACKEQIIPTTPPTCTEKPTTEMTTSATKTTAPPFYQHDLCKALTKGEKIPYPDDCRKYIVCTTPVPLAHYCEDDLWFNAEQQTCVPENVSNCTQPGWTTPTTTESTTITTTETTTETTTTTTEVPPAHPCYGQPEGTMIPYPNNCSKYIVCKTPINVGYDCPDGLEFNAEEKKCTSPETANCSNKTTTELPTTTPTTSTPEDDLCSNKPDGTILPNVYNCSEYIVCAAEKPYMVPCKHDHYFNPYTGVCDPNISPNSCKETTTTTETTTKTTTTEITTSESTTSPGSICTDQPDETTLPKPDNCAQYYVCSNGHALVLPCMPGQYFNPSTGICDSQTSPTACKESSTTPTTTESTSKTTSGSTPPQGICVDEEDGTVLPHTENCAQYIICSNSLPIILPCRSGQYFNPYTGVCDSNTSPTACKETSTTTVSPDTPNICCGHNLGTLLTYPGDCSMYIKCAYPIPELHYCPVNTCFDEARSQCT